MSFVLAALGYALVVVALGGMAHVGALLAARWFHRGTFRWFDAAPAAQSASRAGVVRAMSVVAAFSVAFAFQVIALLIDGDVVPTLSVDVAPGPAERAGMQSGDRIVSVDGKVLTAWEDLRSEVRARPGERRIDVERAGQRLTLVVTPQDGRIFVSPRYRRLPRALPSAVGSANAAMWIVPRAVLKSAFSSTEHTELLGPVGVVKSVGASNAGGSRARLLAAVAAFFWPLVFGVHVFDSVTLALFRMTHSWAATADVDTARRARILQSLLICALCLCVYAVLGAIQEGAGFGNGAMPGLIILAPAAVSTILLVAIAARLRLGLGAAVGFALGSAAIPCAVFLFLGFAVHWQRTELRRRGYAVNWFITSPPGG